jgi:transcriptional regulator with XRE-family HTH domain
VETKVSGIFGKRLHELRGSRSQRELANQLGVTHTTIRNWEAGEVSPSLHNVQQVADHFGVAVAELISEEKAGTTQPSLEEADDLLEKLAPTFNAIRQAVRVAASKKGA